MAFQIEQQARDGVVILRLSGRFVVGDAATQFRSTMESLAAEKQNRVVLDMRHVDYIDSSALGLLVMRHTTTEKAGGALVLFGLIQRHIDLLVITKLVTVFRIAENELDAINLCFPDRDIKSFDILNFVESQQAPKDVKPE